MEGLEAHAGIVVGALPGAGLVAGVVRQAGGVAAPVPFAVLPVDEMGLDVVQGLLGRGRTFRDVQVFPDYVLLVLPNGTQIKCPKEQTFTVSFDPSGDTLFVQPHNPYEIKYTIQSSADTVYVDAIVTKNLVVSIDRKTKLTGTIRVTPGSSVDEAEKLTVFVCDDKKLLTKSFGVKFKNVL